MVSCVVLPLALVVAVLFSSATALPLVRGGKGSLDQGGALPELPVDGGTIDTAEHDDQWEVGVDAGVHWKELVRLAEEYQTEVSPPFPSSEWPSIRCVILVLPEGQEGAYVRLMV
jgi:hypothetical protein